jgi:hypothetical protein
MGYSGATSACGICRQIVSNYNPMKVPSIRMKNGHVDPAGDREPICAQCMARFNQRRIDAGMPPIIVAEDAYEPCEESQMDWGG